MKKLICSIGLLFLFNSSMVFADDEDLYFKTSAMISNWGDIEGSNAGNRIGDYETDTGFGISGAIGKNFGNAIVELEYSYRKVDLDLGDNILDGSVYSASKSLMANVGYEFGKNIKPYILTGIGMTWLNEMDGAEFSFQIGAGLSKEITSHVDIFGGYKYLGSSDFDIENSDIEVSVDSHNFEAGIKYSF